MQVLRAPCSKVSLLNMMNRGSLLQNVKCCVKEDLIPVISAPCITPMWKGPAGARERDFVSSPPARTRIPQKHG